MCVCLYLTRCLYFTRTRARARGFGLGARFNNVRRTRRCARVCVRARKVVAVAVGGSRGKYYLSEIDRKSSSCGPLVFSFSCYRYDNSRNPLRLLPTRPGPLLRCVRPPQWPFPLWSPSSLCTSTKNGLVVQQPH